MLLTSNGKTAICQRQQNGMLAGLREFPILTGWPDQAEVEMYLKQSGDDCKTLEETIHAKHIFSHLEWHMR